MNPRVILAILGGWAALNIAIPIVIELAAARRRRRNARAVIEEAEYHARMATLLPSLYDEDGP